MPRVSAFYGSLSTVHWGPVGPAGFFAPVIATALSVPGPRQAVPAGGRVYLAPGGHLADFPAGAG
jgi:hypothetical protein